MTLHQSSYFWYSFSIKLSWLQRRSNNVNTLVYDRYYLLNCKSITIEKISNHTKYKNTNVPSHLYIFWLTFDKANHTFLNPFLLLGETNFRKNAAWENKKFPFSLWRVDTNLGVSFEWRVAWIKIPEINAFLGMWAP